MVAARARRAASVERGRGRPTAPAEDEGVTQRRLARGAARAYARGAETLGEAALHLGMAHGAHRVLDARVAVRHVEAHEDAAVEAVPGAVAALPRARLQDGGVQRALAVDTGGRHVRLQAELVGA